MLVKVAPMGETVTEVNVEPGTTVSEILAIAGISDNGRSITVNNTPADAYTTVVGENSIVSLANKMKGGR
jgi:putative ubiquitin-RnfH superfamily antitoxin RatB of RatAB toxin-antitoxin module